MYIRKILFGIVFILMSVNITYSQSGWVWQNPTPGLGPTNFSTFFINAETGWLTGPGTIFKSTNAGATWVKQYETYVPAIYSLYFLNTLTGFASGPYGRFFMTTNGGTNWQSKIVGDTSHIFTCTYFLNASTGFVCDWWESRKVFKTTNGGVNWTGYAVNSLPIAIPVYMNFFNDNDGVLITTDRLFGYYSGNPMCYKTSNGGVNWSLLSASPSNKTKSGYFLDMQTGWLCSQDTIYKTTNSGLNWSRSPAKGLNYQLKFINSSTGYSCADSGRIFKTIDAGDSWNLQNNEFANDLYSLSAVGDLCVAVGATGTIVRSSNGGNSWSSTPHSFSYFDMMAIKASNASNIVGINSYNFVVSYNGGANWETYDLPFAPAHAMFFLNSMTGWVITSGSSISRTITGGVTWEKRSIPMSAPVNSIFFINDQTGWATTDNGIYKTLNSGINWTNYVDPNFFLEYDEITFTNELTGWVSADDNLSIVKTTNGGINWFSLGKNQWNAMAMHFLNSQTGWIATYSHFRRTTNGGTTWDSISGVNDIIDMQFVNSLTGWAAASSLPSRVSGKIYRTTDGGFNWITQYSSPYNNFRAVSFINENTGWAVGSYGSILKTTTGGNVFISQTSTEIPEKFSLNQNYPNPFNPTTNIKFDIHKQGIATLKVFDLIGKEMETLVDEQLSVGTFEITFNATSLPSGIYFYVLKTGDFVESKKMILVK